MNSCCLKNETGPQLISQLEQHQHLAAPPGHRHTGPAAVGPVAAALRVPDLSSDVIMKRQLVGWLSE